jgi:hypothetical protein
VVEANFGPLNLFAILAACSLVDGPDHAPLGPFRLGDLGAMDVVHHRQQSLGFTPRVPDYAGRPDLNKVGEPGIADRGRGQTPRKPGLSRRWRKFFAGGEQPGGMPCWIGVHSLVLLGLIESRGPR